MRKHLAPLAILTLAVTVITGCISFSGSRSPSRLSSQPEESVKERTIQVSYKMREQVVNPNIGRWAVVIGISDYAYDTRTDRRRGIPDLQYAHRDARAFAHFLMSPQGGAFPKDRVMLLINRKATVKNVRKAIGDFLARSLEDDLVIIYFAGHGTPDPNNPNNLYLLCHDTEPGNYYGTALPMREIDIVLNYSIRSKRVIVLADACHSAGVGGTRTKGVSKKFNEYLDKLAQSKEGVTKITASRADEISLERDYLGGGHGVFTYFLLEGLKGKGDKNADGFVTMAEAYDYLYDRVRSDTRHSQNPWASGYVSTDIPLGIVDGETLRIVADKIEEPETTQTIEPGFRPAPDLTDLPRDSSVALKIVHAKLAKGDVGDAKYILDAVIGRNDAAKPDALAIKIEIFIREGNLRAAEDSEDLLVIPYPDHSAAMKGAKLVYEYYLKEAEAASPGDGIRRIEAYLQRHPSGLLEPDARKKLETMKADLSGRYRRVFN